MLYILLYEIVLAKAEVARKAKISKVVSKDENIKQIEDHKKN